MTRPIRRGTRVSEAALRFTFDGKRYDAQLGDTAASALLANGVRAMGRSVKYRRLRGVMAAGPEEPNALLTVGRAPHQIPNAPAPQLLLTDGMELQSQNAWPSLRFDLASLLQLGSGIFGAGFYYKTFIWPSWTYYEGMIRRLAGLGAAPGAAALARGEIEHFSCDVLIAGAGAAGLAAARAATRAGARVVLCEREPLCGGELEFETAAIDGHTGAAWIATVLEEIGERGARVLTSTTVVGAANGRVIAHRESGGLPSGSALVKIRPRALVVAMGAVERPIAFADNDRPGIMLLNAAERYASRYGVRVGRDTVIFANHDRAYVAAQRLLASGLKVHAIIDPRRRVGSDALSVRDTLLQSGVECLSDHLLIAAHGSGRVRSVRLAPCSAPGSRRELACDAVLVSGGWTPADRLGGPERELAGAAQGALVLGDAVASGHRAGIEAARVAGFTRAAGDAPRAQGDPRPQLEPFWASPATRAEEKKQFVDFQNDVTVADLRAALTEGFRDIEHVKRYTTLGVGTEQGRMSGEIGAAIIAELKGEPHGAAVQSRPRPPLHPVAMHTLAGRRTGMALRVARRTPLHDWHLAHGGILESTGLWMRPRYYQANGGSAFDAGIVEARRVRQAGGIVDASTLGKIEVAGTDAAAFLDRLYVGKASTIRVGRSRYMVNLREDGMVLDDGLVLRLAPDRFLATTSSGHGAHMLSHFEFYRASEWAGRAVALADVTDEWAVIAAAGPESKLAVGRSLGGDWPALLEELPHMAYATGRWAGREMRVLRASFSGERAYELHCPATLALRIWESLLAAGLSPYGLEALDILRVEKGYLTSAEINGQTTPFDLAMRDLMQPGLACVGADLLDRPGFHEPARPRLVGLRALDGRAPFLAGAQIIARDDAGHAVGHVTSSVFSPALGEWIGLGLLAREIADAGTEIIAYDPLRQGNVRLKAVSPVHFDAGGERMRC